MGCAASPGPSRGGELILWFFRGFHALSFLPFWVAVLVLYIDAKIVPNVGCVSKLFELTSGVANALPWHPRCKRGRLEIALFFTGCMPATVRAGGTTTGKLDA